MKKIVNRIFRNYIFHPAFLAIIVALLWEWKKLHFQTIKDFPNEPISTIIVIGLLYGASFLIVIGIQKLFSESEFLTETELKTKLEEIIKETDDFLYIISPYLDPGNVLLEAILSTKRKNVKVVLVHNSSQVKKVQLRNDFTRLINSGVEIYNHPKLHSKIYLNESSSLITSLNLISGSFSNSFESGMYISSRSDRKSIYDYINKTILGSDMCVPTQIEDLPQQEGYCIRTKQKIPFNPERPIEYNEYKSHGSSVVGKYCHSCGQEVQTTVELPFCANCQELHSIENNSSNHV